jgi:protein-S-isoprenylcysteine O-methyltransferase Ste14
VSDTVHLVAIILAWAIYGLIHSWLAGTAMKHRLVRRWPVLESAYRLLYNLQAALLSLPPLALTWFYPGEALWHWPAWIAWPALLIAVAGFVWSMRWYDGMDFLGLRQWRGHDAHSTYHETLIFSPLHRCVRHPWYSLGLLYLWTRDLNAGWLAATLAITIYIVIGSRLEERKLATQFGESYRRYLARVPGLIPIPSRCLSQAELIDLQQGKMKN